MATRFGRLGIFVVCGLASAQSVRVYSEFQRIDPFGNIVAVDKAETPREILSPAVVRGARASFQAAVTVPEGQQYSFFIGQNPENTVAVTVYKEQFVKHAEAWIPDGLRKIPLSDAGAVSDAGKRMPGQTTTVYWLDVWVRPTTPVGRFRFEVQLNVGERWIIYPMEIRVLSPVLPDETSARGAPGAIDASADTSARKPLLGFVCGTEQAGRPGPPTVRSLILRNAQQDAVLARMLEPEIGKAVLAGGILKALGSDQPAETWCQSPAFPTGFGAEWYLRVRDYLYRTADVNKEAAASTARHRE